MTVAETRPLLELEQEVRFAVVMYGGVSLAIYINGVAQELFRLVRATAPERPYARMMQDAEAERRAYFADEESPDPRPKLSGSERVYRELGQWLGIGGASEPAAGATPPPLRTRFVVDIISGTSAGGINGVFLAKAIANQQEFDVSAGLWLEAAQLDSLLRGEKSWEGIEPRPDREPESLLNGYRLYAKARQALDKMAQSEPVQIPGDDFRPAYAEQLDLAVTATDLAGLSMPVRLRPDHFVYEQVHRKVFRFEYGTAEATGEDHNDFGADGDLMLGFAARATSSFPFAFEPVRLADLEAIEPASREQADPKTWMGEYREPAKVFFADGGYLDNKPFSYATDALRRRRADVPVVRRLLYIEPDPASPAAREPAERKRPDPYQNLGDMFSLPRFEPIRQDIEAVAGRNGAVMRLRRIEALAEEAIDRDDAAPSGPAYTAYRSLRERDVLDQLAELAADVSGIGEKQASALRQALGDAAGRTVIDDLGALDSGFHQRRLSFLQDRVNELLRGDARPADTARRLGIAGAPGEDSPAGELPEHRAKALRRVKLELNAAYQELRRALRAPKARKVDAVLDGEQRGRFDRVHAAAATAAADPGEYLSAVRAYLEPPLRAVRRDVARALASPRLEDWMRELLGEYAEQFESVDMIVLPLAYPDLGEVNAVEIWRVSPRDAPEIAPATLADDPVSKLAGIGVRHFAAFFDRSWRVNDIMWGRLDGAETIVDAILAGDSAELRARFREGAQAAILRETLEEAPPGSKLARALEAELRSPPSREADHALVTAFRQRWERPQKLTREREQQLTADSLRVAGPVLAQHAGDYRIPPAPLRALGRAAPLVVGVVGRFRRLRERFGWQSG
jgi:patatin-related protein